MKNFSIFLLVSATVFFASCDSKLSREKAKELIIQKINLPEDLVWYIGGNGTTIDHFSLGLPGSGAEFIEAGLVYETYPESRIWNNRYLTETGKKYLAYSKIVPQGSYVNDICEWGGGVAYGNPWVRYKIGVKISKVKFGDITGVLENYNGIPNKARVDYTLIIMDVTPFGRLLETTHGRKFSEGLQLKYHASLEKYDDGWRVERAKE